MMMEYVVRGRKTCSKTAASTAKSSMAGGQDWYSHVPDEINLSLEIELDEPNKSDYEHKPRYFEVQQDFRLRSDYRYPKVVLYFP